MQIIIVTSEFGKNAGGLSYSCTTFSKMLKELGHTVIIVSSIDDSVIESDCEHIDDAVKIVDGGYKQGLKNHLFFRVHIKNVLLEIENKKTNYIVAFGAGYNGLLASELSRIAKIKLVTMLRGSEINLSISDFDLRQANYYCLKQSTTVIALSNELLEYSKAIYFDSQINYKVIPNIINIPQKIDFSFSNKNNLVLGCGAFYLNEKKGVANLIEMLFHLNSISNKKFCFEFVGKIDKDLLIKYKELNDTLNISHCVKFIGGLSRRQFIERMRYWDFYVQGSFCEGFSNSVSDYISLGKPFILTNTGFIAETIKTQCPEILFENFVPKEMANKINEITDNKYIGNIYEKAYDLIGKLTDKNTIYNLFSELFSIQDKQLSTNPLCNKNILAVLLHDISLDTYTNIDTPLSIFKNFVEQIANNGYVLCSAQNYFASSNRSNLIILTFDDAYIGVIKYALPILKQFGFNATVFVCSDYIGKSNAWNLKDTTVRKHLNIEELKVLQSEGWEIGSHGCTHNSLLRLSEDDLNTELLESKKYLSKTFGKIESYAYPYGDFNEYCKNRVADNYNIAFATSKGRTFDGIDNCQIRRYSISELNNLIK